VYSPATLRSARRPSRLSLSALLVPAAPSSGCLLSADDLERSDERSTGGAAEGGVVGGRFTDCHGVIVTQTVC